MGEKHSVSLDWRTMFLAAAVGWLILSLFLAILGSHRKIGGFVAFLVSIVFSPLIGLLCVALSGSPSEPVVIHNYAQHIDKTGELERLARLKETGALSTEEFEAEKRRVLSNAARASFDGPVDTTTLTYEGGRFIGRYGKYILIAIAIALVLAAVSS